MQEARPHVSVGEGAELLKPSREFLSRRRHVQDLGVIPLDHHPALTGFLEPARFGFIVEGPFGDDPMQL